MDRLLRAAHLRERAEWARRWSTAFVAGADDGGDHPGADGVLGVDELHIVYTRVQVADVADPAGPLDGPDGGRGHEEDPGLLPEYEFEPDAEELLGALLPKYINTRIYAALLDSAARESARGNGR